MQIDQATITIDGNEYEFLSMSVTDLAHELIRMSQPKLNTVIPEETLQRWKTEAALDYVKSPITLSAQESHVSLYMRMKAEQFFAIERLKHSYNVAVIELSDKLQALVDKPDEPALKFKTDEP